MSFKILNLENNFSTFHVITKDWHSNHFGCINDYRQTNKQTHRQTLLLYDWPGPEDRVSEKPDFFFIAFGQIICKIFSCFYLIRLFDRLEHSWILVICLILLWDNLLTIKQLEQRSWLKEVISNLFLGKMSHGCVSTTLFSV